MNILRPRIPYVVLVSLFAAASMAQTSISNGAGLPDLAISLSSGITNPSSYSLGEKITLNWTIHNQSETPCNSANISIYLTHNDSSAILPVRRRLSQVVPNQGQEKPPGEDLSSSPTVLGGMIVYQDSTGAMAAHESKQFQASFRIPRSVEPGPWNLAVVVDGAGTLYESSKLNNLLFLPIQVVSQGTTFFTLDFEGLDNNVVIPANYYSSYGVTIQNMISVRAFDAEGTGNFCSVHSGSATAASAGFATASGQNRVIVNFQDGFSDIDMIYAQATDTNGGFRIYSGLNATGSLVYTYQNVPHPNNGHNPPCYYDIWYPTGLIEVAGKSIEFYENDLDPSLSWYLFDNISFTPSRNEIVVFDDPILPREGESAGHTFRVSLSEPIPAGKTVTLKLERTSPTGSGESLAVKGTNTLSFTSSNWNTPKPLSIWAPENDTDTNNQTRSFRIYRNGGTSPQVIADRSLSVTEIDDDFHLTIAVSSNSNHGTVSPTFQQGLFDYDDDDWPSLEFTATPHTGYMFSEWAVSTSGENNDLFFQLFGVAQNPTQIEQLILDSGGSTNIAVFATFDELGPVTVSMLHQGSGTTRVNSQVVGNNQSTQIEPLQNISLSATPAPGWVFANWSSDPAGVIANPLAPSTTINTSTNTLVTANFIIAPVSVTVFHAGEGTTTINGLQVGPNQSVQIPPGQTVPIAAQADLEWAFDFWSSNPGGIVGDANASQTFLNTPIDANLTANFRFVGTQFTLENDGNGTTQPSGTQFVSAGDSVTVEVVPNEGFKFQDWTVVSGTPDIILIHNQTNHFLVTVTDPTVIRANFKELAPGTLLIKATNLRDTSEVVMLREPVHVIQELIFLKQEGGAPDTFKLEFFREGDLPLIIETVTLDDRFDPLPDLTFSGFCLMPTPNFDPLSCVLWQPLSPNPLPPPGTANPPTLYLDFGRDPGFPDLPNPAPDFYVGSFAILENGIPTTLIFDFQGIVEGSTDVSNISLEKIYPEPEVSIPNSGIVSLDPVSGGSITPITFKLTNADTLNPFFVDKQVSNTNTGVDTTPDEFGFFFSSTNSIIVPKGGMLEFSMTLNTKAINADEPNVTYSAVVQLGTGENIYAFHISAVADGTSVQVMARVNNGGGEFELINVFEGETHLLQPKAPESGSIYEFLVVNPSSQQSLEISNLQLDPPLSDHGVFVIEQDQSTLPGTIDSGQTGNFSIRIEGSERLEPYFSDVSFDYRSPSGIYKTFTFSIQGTVGNALLRLLGGIEIPIPIPIPNFDEIPLPPSTTGQTESLPLEVQHQGIPGDPTLAGTITTDQTAAFSVVNPNFSLQPGQQHAFQVHFTPSQPGNYVGNVTISSNDPVVDTFALTLTGTVFEPGAPPTAVPNFVGTIQGENIDGLEIFHTNPLVEFTWDDALTPLAIKRYHIVLQPLGGPWLYSTQYLTPVNAASIQTENLVFGTSYSIHIRAQDTDDVWGPFNLGGSFTLAEPGPPTAVPDFVGQIGGQNISGLVVQSTAPEVSFTWNHASSTQGISQYQIVLQPQGGPWLYSQTVPYPATQHVIQTSGLQPTTTYTTHIRAKDILGVWGPFINGGSFTIANILPPGSVPNFVGRIGGQNINGLNIIQTNPTVDFTWTPPSSALPLVRYQIVIQPTDGGGWLYSPQFNAPATSLTIPTSGLLVGKSYSIHIRAQNNAGLWGPFNDGGSFHVVEPGPPGSVPNFVGRINGQNINGLTVNVTNPTVAFTWTPPTSDLPLRRYQVVLQPHGGPWLYSPMVNHPTTTLSLPTVNLQYATSYSIHIHAENEAGIWGPFNNGGSFTLEEPGPPSAVPNFVGKISGQNVDGLSVPITNPAINFTWSPATAGLGIDRYQIVLQPTDGSGWLYAPQIIAPASSHSIQTTDLVYGVCYSIHIRARDAGGMWGPFSNGGSFCLVEPIPPAVTTFNGTYNGQNINGQVLQNTSPLLQFTWVEVTDPTGIERYQIVLQPTDGSGWLYSPNILAPVNSLAIQTNGLTPGKTYSIHIRAKNHLGNWGPFYNGGTFSVQ